MTKEERIKELEEKGEPNQGWSDDWEFGYNDCLDESLSIIKELQEENEELKALLEDAEQRMARYENWIENDQAHIEQLKAWKRKEQYINY